VKNKTLSSRIPVKQLIAIRIFAGPRWYPSKKIRLVKVAGRRSEVQRNARKIHFSLPVVKSCKAVGEV